MPKLNCTPQIAKNFKDYYLIKWGLKKYASLVLKTSPDFFNIHLEPKLIRNNKGLFKSIFRLIRENRLMYYRESNRMIIYDRSKRVKKEFTPNIMAIETIERAIDLGKNPIDYNNGFFLIKVIENVRFLIRRNTTSDIQVLEENFIKNQYSFLYPYIKNGVILDIGGNIGDTAVLFCTKGAKKVYVYEPDSILYTLSLKNIRLNNLQERIEIKNYGVGEKEAVLNIEGNHKRWMKIIPFSKIIDNMEKVDVLKMDCEGAEFPAILSCSLPCLKKIRVIGMEYHKNPAPLIKYLLRAGFDIEIKKETKAPNRWTGLLLAVLRE